MKEQIKKYFNEYLPFFKGVLVSLGIIGIFDWVIAPGLTSQNTILNIISLLMLIGVLLFIGVSVYELFFKQKNKNKDDGKIY